VHRIRSDFNRQVIDAANQLPSQLSIRVANIGGGYRFVGIQPPLSDFASPANHAVIRILTVGGGVVAMEPASAPPLGLPTGGPVTVNGYRVVSRFADVHVASSEAVVGHAIIQYGRRTSDTEATVARVELFLVLGVLAGSGFALLAGMAIARRAMAPIAQLTSTAEAIARTRDPARSVPQPPADAEV